MAEHVVLHLYTALQIGAIRFISVFRGERTKPQTAIQIIRILFPSSIYMARNAFWYFPSTSLVSILIRITRSFEFTQS